MCKHVFLAFLFSLAGGLTSLAAGATIASALEQPILPAGLALAQMQDFLEREVADLPRVDDATQWQAYAPQLRQQILDLVVYRGQAAAWRDAQTGVQWQDVIENPGPGYRIRKFILEALPGLWVPGALYEPTVLSGSVPLILNCNGHSTEDIAYPPKQIRCINQAKRGMLALNIGFMGYGQTQTSGFSHMKINQIDLCGTSGVATFYLVLKRALDLGLSLPNADPERVAVTGLSGGGWQTIFISPLDTRVKLCDPVAGFSSLRTRVRHFQDLGDSEQAPVDLGWVADYTHLVALMAPRPTLLTYNQFDDCCFQAPYALPPLVDAAQPIFQLLGVPGNLRTHVNFSPGTHNYEVDNRQALYQMLGDFFYPGDPNYSAVEIPSDSELRDPSKLAVQLPVGNKDFHTLALGLSQGLPRHPEIPADPVACRQWQTERRGVLRELVRLNHYDVTAVPVSAQTIGDVSATGWKLEMGPDWTIPAVMFTPAAATGTMLVLADGGRAAAAAYVDLYVGLHRVVVAMDPTFVGEAAPGSYRDLMSIMLSSVGHRPVGLEVAQVIATASWMKGERGLGPISLVSLGRRTGLVARVAAALAPELFADVTPQSGLPSLRSVIASDWTVAQGPELFCFGLLEQFDIPQLVALALPPPPTPTPTPTPAGPADVWVDGRIDRLDLFHFSLYWQQDETEYSHRADLMDDNKIDEQDLLEFIDAFLTP